MESAHEGTLQRAAVRIRDFQPEDRPAVVEVLNAADPDRPMTVEEHRHDDEAYVGTPYRLRRFVAVNPGSEAIVGEGTYFHLPWAYDPARFGVWFAVHPAHQGLGIGGALYERVAKELRALGARQLRTWTQTSRTRAIEFLDRRGFRELMRSWESRLDVTAFDPARFREYRDLPPGIEVTTLAAELARDPSALEQVYEMDCALAQDVPRYDPFTSPGFDLYRHHVLENPRALPEATFLAKDRDRFVGVSSLERFDALPGVFNTGFTGVRREYRGRGIAFALKLRAIDYAACHGIREIRTGNSSLNAPMLAINVKLGFVKEPVWVSMGKELSGGS